jgi:predicted kinase
VENTMVIMRGPPGSGKSTFVGLLSVLCSNGCAECQGSTKHMILSLDDFRIVDGKYVFDPARERDVVSDYHSAVRDAVDREIPLIILDNVHSRLWELERTRKMGEEAGYRIFVVEVQSDFWTCLTRMVHPVPFDKLKEIFERWESWLHWSIQDRLDGLERLLYRTITSERK